MVQRIETTLVNGRRATLTNYKHYKQSKKFSNEGNYDNYSEIIQNSINKEIRLEYFTSTKEFYEKLKLMCEKLKEIPNNNDERNKELRVYMKSFNNLLLKLREENSMEHNNLSKNFFKGIILPFDDSKSTLDEFECEDWDLLYIKSDETNGEINYQENNTDKSLTESNEKVKVYKSLQDFIDEMKINQEEEDKIELRRKSKIEKTILEEINDISKEECLINFSEISSQFGKKFSDTCCKIKKNSPFRKFKTYRISTFIAKSNDDLRQEQMAMQLIKSFNDVFTLANISLKLRPYEILITSSTSGLIEFLPNSISIDALKKKFPADNLNTFYRTYFKKNFEDAQKNFVESLAAYSLICYIMQIKDRHNGNILVDMNGFIIHIDFGFILSISPGNFNFENAPFKMTNEYLDIMDGPDSAFFHYFKSLFLRGLMELKKHVDTFIKIIEVMSKGSKLPCFSDDPSFIINNFKERFHINKNEYDLVKFVHELVETSLSNWRTSQYDYYQKMTNGIIP